MGPCYVLFGISFGIKRGILGFIFSRTLVTSIMEYVGARPRCGLIVYILALAVCRCNYL